MLFFMLSIVLFLMLYPLFETSSANAAIMTIGMSIVLFFGITAVSVEIHEWIVGLILAVIAIALGIGLNLNPGSSELRTAYLSTNLIFYLYTVVVILYEISRSPRVSLEIIFGALSGYLLIGLVGAICFAIIEHFAPGSISFNGDDFAFHNIIYFSFVTLTTLGYGDMLPESSFARSLASLLAVVGQFYLTVLVAMFVGTYISHRRHHFIE